MFNFKFAIPWAWCSLLCPAPGFVAEGDESCCTIWDDLCLQEPNGYGITASLKGLTWQIISPAPPALAAQDSDLLMLLRSCPRPRDGGDKVNNLSGHGQLI